MQESRDWVLLPAAFPGPRRCKAARKSVLKELRSRHLTTQACLINKSAGKHAKSCCSSTFCPFLNFQLKFLGFSFCINYFIIFDLVFSFIKCILFWGVSLTSSDLLYSFYFFSITNVIYVHQKNITVYRNRTTESSPFLPKERT